jgi:short-chain fatty acids transporter
LPTSIRQISGVIPLGQTIGLWQSFLVALALGLLSYAICYYSAPAAAQARGMQEMGVEYVATRPDIGRADRPGEWLEHSPLLTLLITFCGVAYLIREVVDKGAAIILDLNHYVFLFLIAGLLLHWRPRAFSRAVSAAVPSVAGVLVQYPLYAGIVRMMTESGLARHIADFFVTISNQHTFPLLVGVYSAVLGLFIPSAGGKWLVEAPYLLQAAKAHQVHLGWVVQTYNATEALANLVHPFWMLPLLGILGLKARDIVGYSTLQFVVHVPVVLFLVWILNYTLQYIPPIIP